MMTATWCLLAVLLILNVLAYLHARSMTHFAAGGVRTHRPEMLSLRQKAKVLITGITLPRPCNLVTPDSFGLTFETHRFRSDGGPELAASHLPYLDPTALVLLFHGDTP